MGSRPPPRRYRKFSAKGAEGIYNTDDIMGSFTKSNNNSTCSSQTGDGRQMMMSPQQCFQQKICDGANKREGKEAIDSEEESDIDMLWRMNLEEEEEEEDDTEEYCSTAESTPSNEDEMKKKRTMMMMKKLKEMIPGGVDRQMNTAAVLDETFKYIEFLHSTVQKGPAVSLVHSSRAMGRGAMAECDDSCILVFNRNCRRR